MVQVIGADVQVAVIQSPRDALGVDLDADRDTAVQRDRQRLCAAHAAEAGGQRDRPRERPTESLARDGGKGLVRALQDSLRPDVDP